MVRMDLQQSSIAEYQPAASLITPLSKQNSQVLFFVELARQGFEIKGGAEEPIKHWPEVYEEMTSYILPTLPSLLEERARI